MHPVISVMLSWISELGCLCTELQLTNQGWILFPDKATYPGDTGNPPAAVFVCL